MDNEYAQFLVNAGLYDRCEISSEKVLKLIELIKGNVNISCYCKECDENRVFQMDEILFYSEDCQQMMKRVRGKTGQ